LKLKGSKLWLFAFLAVPVLYFIAQFIPYYHSGGVILPSLGSLFWFPENNEVSIYFISLFYHGFRVNDLVTALLGTQFLAILLIIMTLILKSSGLVALFTGCWGLFGLLAFLTTRSLTFSPVNVYGGIAGILMLVLFLAAVALSVIYLTAVYRNYRKNVSIVNAEQAEVEQTLADQA